jgi:formylmethanofuran dehydrogenase subunit E
MLSTEESLQRFEKRHGDLCPGQLLGIRMAVLGCKLIGIEDPTGFDRKKLIVWIEIDRWLADAVEAVTGARLGKRNLKFLDYGKLAATFLNVESGEAVRVVALGSSRDLANQSHPEIEDKHLRQMTTYREAADEELFGVRTVKVTLNDLDAPGHPKARVICSDCGEEVNDGREVITEDDLIKCQPCALSSEGHLAVGSRAISA